MPNRKSFSAVLHPISVFLLSGLLSLFFHPTLTNAQNADEAYVKEVRALEAAGWKRVDTVITFDPVTYAKTVTYRDADLSPRSIDGGEPIFQKTDQKPEFPGGQDALAAFLKAHVKYPAGQPDRFRGGQVGLNFVVETDGSLSNVYYYPINKMPLVFVEEGHRVLKLMPAWKPAKHRGKTVRSEHMITIRF
jgi:hypothetical protein